MLDRILGFIRPNAAARSDSRPALPPVALITGGAAAPELGMLCRDTTHDALASIEALRMVDLKADGLRAHHIDGRIVSREGVPLGCALHCQPALRRLEEAYGEPMFFDGEYVADGGYAATVAEHKRGEGSGVLWLFDAVPMSAWLTGSYAMPLVDRRAQLMHHIGAVESEFVGCMEGWMMTGQQTIAKAAELWAYGYEGIVSKRADSGYERRRSNDWLRLKQTFTADLPIVDTVWKDGTLKAVIARGPDGVGPIKFGRGWSLDEALRLNRMFHNADYLRGEAIQQNVFDQLTRVRANTHGGDTPMLPPVARVSYQLSTGDKRTVRGAVFHNLV